MYIYMYAYIHKYPLYTDYLDNCLRGGVPVVLGDPEHPKILHTFNRVHGDIERDYNWFNLEPTFFSQGIYIYMYI
jgi:hypothetical protein